MLIGTDEFVEAVQFCDVRPGDRVARTRFESFEVAEVSGPSDPATPCIHLHCMNGVTLTARANTYIGRRFRPWPEGKTKQDMLLDVDKAMTAAWMGSVKPAIGRARLVAALLAYGLGEPEFAEEPRNESLVDRHMTL